MRRPEEVPSIAPPSSNQRLTTTAHPPLNHYVMGNNVKSWWERVLGEYTLISIVDLGQ